MNTFLPHLIELRTRVIRSSIVVMLLFIGFFWIDEYLYSFIAKPLISQLPKGGTMVATEVTTTFMVPMKLAFVVALLVAVPYVLYQIWGFVAPGLYTNEKRSILPFLFASILLFYLGSIFAYSIICPMALGFFAKCAPPNVTVMTDIKAYLDFVLSILLAGGIAFQVPIITVALIKSRLISIVQLEHLRPYIIVAAFILGMLLTPPDVISQVLLALPMWGLFEGGLVLAKYTNKP